MTEATLDDVLQRLFESKILSQDDAAKVRAECKSREAQPDGAKVILAKLVKQQQLTKWQAVQLLNGNGILRLGSYLLLNRLGSHALGNTLLAKHETLGNEVALLVVAESIQRAPDQIGAFFEMTRAFASVDHRGLAKVADVEDVDGYNSFVCQPLPVKSLADWIADQDKPDKSRIAEIVLEWSKGLKRLHGAGAVHGHLHPGVIGVDAQGSLLIYPFDVSFSPPIDDAARSYFCPHSSADPLNFSQATHRDDLVSLGRMGLYMLTGQAVPLDKTREHNSALIQALSRAADPTFAEYDLEQFVDDLSKYTKKNSRMSRLSNGDEDDSARLDRGKVKPQRVEASQPANKGASSNLAKLSQDAFASDSDVESFSISIDTGAKKPAVEEVEPISIGVDLAKTRLEERVKRKKSKLDRDAEDESSSSQDDNDSDDVLDLLAQQSKAAVQAKIQSQQNAMQNPAIGIKAADRLESLKSGKNRSSGQTAPNKSSKPDEQVSNASESDKRKVPIGLIVGIGAGAVTLMLGIAVAGVLYFSSMYAKKQVALTNLASQKSTSLSSENTNADAASGDPVAGSESKDPDSNASSQTEPNAQDLLAKTTSTPPVESNLIESRVLTGAETGIENSNTTPPEAVNQNPTTANPTAIDGSIPVASSAQGTPAESKPGEDSALTASDTPVPAQNNPATPSATTEPAPMPNNPSDAMGAVTNPEPVDVFKDVPAYVELPALGTKSQPAADFDQSKDLAKVNLHPADILLAQLYGGGKAFKNTSKFELKEQPGSGKFSWRFTFAPDVKALSSAITIAELSVVDNTLKFQWTKDALSHEAANYLGNCLLELKTGTERRLVQLRKPIVLEPVKLDAKNLIGRTEAKFEYFPANDGVTIEVLEFDQTLPKHSFFEGKTKLKFGVKDVTGVWFGEAPNQFLGMEITAISRGKIVISITSAVQLTSGREKYPGEKKFMQSFQNLKVSLQNMQELIASGDYAKSESDLRGSAEYKEQIVREKAALQLNINRTTEDVKSLQMLVDALPALIAGEVAFRVYFQADEFQVDLATPTGEPLPPPAPAAEPAPAAK
jgi:hypothetical protein